MNRIIFTGTTPGQSVIALRQAARYLAKNPGHYRFTAGTVPLYGVQAYQCGCFLAWGAAFADQHAGLWFALSSEDDSPSSHVEDVFYDELEKELRERTGEDNFSGADPRLFPEVVERYIARHYTQQEIEEALNE